MQNVNSLFNKVDDLENRLRRNNIRLVGVLEKAKSRKSWLLNMFGKETLSPFSRLIISLCGLRLAPNLP